MREENGAIVVARSVEEWRSHPVGRRLAAKPIVEVVKIGDSAPVKLLAGSELPLNGLRVLATTPT